MKHYPLINAKFPNVSDDTLSLIFSHVQKDNDINSMNFELWFLQTFKSELDVVDWLLDRDPDLL